ncbi:MAG: hypothetical protein ABIP45_04475 [Knoellia sp.]
MRTVEFLVDCSRLPLAGMGIILDSLVLGGLAPVTQGRLLVWIVLGTGDFSVLKGALGS